MTEGTNSSVKPAFEPVTEGLVGHLCERTEAELAASSPVGLRQIRHWVTSFGIR